jgi:hypothetical protein
MSKASPLWTLAKRADKMNPSVIREILKVTRTPQHHQLCGWPALAQDILR